MVNNPNTQQAEIIRLFRNREKCAVEAVCDHYGAILYGVIFKIVENDVLAEEVLNDTLQFAWHHHSLFNESTQSLGSWLLGIARKEALKKSPVKTFIQNQNAFSYVDRSSMGNTLHNDNLKQNRNSMIRDDARKVLYLIYFKGSKVSEVARFMGVDEVRVKQLLREAVSYYRKELQQA